MTDKVEFNKLFYNEQWRHSWKARFMYDPISKRNIARYVLRKVKFQNRNKSIVDIGFGFGIILFDFDRSNHIAGIEVADSAVEFARIRAKKLGFNQAKFFKYEGMGNLPFKSSSADLIVCSHVLEHVPDDNYLLEEIRRILKPSGYALLNVPINDEHFEDPRHMRHYRADEFLAQVRAKGFLIRDTYAGDRLWNVFGWFFEKNFHNRLSLLGFLISSFVNVFFSSLPFALERVLERTILQRFKPRQFAVCVQVESNE